ncbi:MAG: hypothetical protein FJZ01_10695 [Candidatus Sericytochromatia bacterium]|nr:hypothetical protein [Candidatus Tanganyikabacteria bacterium]
MHPLLVVTFALLATTLPRPDADWRPARQHRSPEADAGFSPCRLPIRLLGIPVAEPDVRPAYPQWVPVEDETFAILEGTVIAKSAAPGSGPHTAVNDMPTSHHTHDMCFPVLPDPTPDGRFTNLLGIQVHADGRESVQRTIGIEWESGLGADNDGNAAAVPNRRGDGFGYYPAGHRRGEILWNWPTEGDRVHIAGRWIWDRGHPPYKTEIHPAHFVAVLRRLPDLGGPGGQVATRADVFASGDGGALWNHFADAPAFVARPRMGARDYEFELPVRQARPALDSSAQMAWRLSDAGTEACATDAAGGAGRHARAKSWEPHHESVLAWSVEVRPGDTFPGDLEILPAGDRVRVRVPWRSRAAADSAVLARTVRVWWQGAVAAPVIRRRVILDEVEILKTHDLGNGEYRVFADVGGQWVFLNEFLPVADVLRQGLGDTPAPAKYPIAKAFEVVLPASESFRVYADGWEADGVNALFGRLVDPNHPCDDAFRDKLTGGIGELIAGGGRDDGIGATKAVHGADSLGDFADRSWHGIAPNPEDPEVDFPTFEDTDPAGSFVLRYRIEAL